LLAVKTDIFASKGELRRMTDGGALSINKEKTDNPDRIIAVSDLLNKKYLLVQKGRKNYYLIKSI
jgi:tyrosyl-tRNA synthetase